MRRVVTADDLAASMRGRRQALGLTQAEVATRAGVARSWVAAVEHGKPGAEVGRILRLLDVLGLSLHVDSTDGPGLAHERTVDDRVDIDDLLETYRNR